MTFLYWNFICFVALSNLQTITRINSSQNSGFSKDDQKSMTQTNSRIFMNQPGKHVVNNSVKASTGNIIDNFSWKRQQKVIKTNDYNSGFGYGYGAGYGNGLKSHEHLPTINGKIISSGSGEGGGGGQSGPTPQNFPFKNYFE